MRHPLPSLVVLSLLCLMGCGRKSVGLEGLNGPNKFQVPEDGGRSGAAGLGTKKSGIPGTLPADLAAGFDETPVVFTGPLVASTDTVRPQNTNSAYGTTSISATNPILDPPLSFPKPIPKPPANPNASLNPIDSDIPGGGIPAGIAAGISQPPQTSTGYSNPNNPVSDQEVQAKPSRLDGNPAQSGRPSETTGTLLTSESKVAVGDVLRAQFDSQWVPVKVLRIAANGFVQVRTLAKPFRNGLVSRDKLRVGAGAQMKLGPAF